MVITDHYKKLAREISVAETLAAHVASVFMNNWVFPYGIPRSLLTYNAPIFISRLLKYVFTVLGVRKVAITAYHAQSNGQTERYNQTFERILRHYVNEHQNTWDQFVQSLTYAYNTQVHR